jgi:hypothetical protein
MAGSRLGVTFKLATRMGPEKHSPTAIGEWNGVPLIPAKVGLFDNFQFIAT